MRFPNKLPELFPTEAVKQLVDLVSQPSLVQGLKDAAQRMGWKEAWQPAQLQEAMQQAKRWMETVAQSFSQSPTGIRPCINATGEIFSDGLGGYPLDPEVIRAQSSMQSSFVSGGNSILDKKKILDWVSCEDVWVAGSVAQAILALGQLAAAKEGWIVPRTDCIRLPKTHGTSQKIKDLLEAMGKEILEIGASNECGASDFDEALAASIRPVLTTYPSSLDGLGATGDHHQAALDAAKKVGAMVAELLWTGCWNPLSFGATSGIAVRDRIAKGVDLLVIPGDGLLGGPTCGIVLGNGKVIRELSEIGDRYGLSASGSTLAGLQAAIDIASSEDRWNRSPLGAILTNSLDNLKNRAQRIAKQLEGNPWIESVSTDIQDFSIGSSAWSRMQMASSLLRIQPAEGKFATIVEALEGHDSPILFRKDGDVIVLVLRTVDPGEDHAIVSAFWPETE